MNAKWQNKSNGINHIIFDPGEDWRTVAECGRREDAQLICDMHNDGLTTVDRMKAFADTRLAEVQTKIEAEILDTEGAMIYATDQGEWNRRAVLEGHKSGLLWVSNRIKEMLNES